MTTIDAVPAAMDVRFQGFDLKVGPPGKPALARATAERVVAEHLGAGWQLVSNTLDPQQFDVVPTGASLTVAESWDKAREMAQDRDVVWAEPILQTPNLTVETTPGASAPGGPETTRGIGEGDTGTKPNWHIEQCGISTAWTMTPKPGGKARGEGVIIGHPDTGYRPHVEIFTQVGNRIRVADAFDFVGNRPDALALEGGSTHGTATASVIMSSDTDVLDPGVKGVAPMSEIIPMRTDNDVIHFTWGTARRAVERAIEKSCHVISMSFGGPLAGPSFHRAIQMAVEKGIIVVAAAGNEVHFVTFPGRYDEVVCAAATNQKSTPWSGSCRGPAVDIAAPGESVWRATIENGQDVVKPSNGTSYAAAVVAGVAALWLAHHGRDNLIAKYGARNLAAVFKELVMTQGVDVPLGWDRSRFGAGIVNAQKVLSAALPDTAPSRGIVTVRGVGVPSVRTKLDEIAEYFPDTPREVVQANLSNLLNTTPAQLEDVLTRFGEELKLQVAMNPEVRGRVGGAATLGTTTRGGPAEAVAASVAGRAMLSSGLRGRMAM
jgi:serine protease